jgi:hypothetical protein
MRKISKKTKVVLIIGAVLVAMFATYITTFAYDVDPPVGFVAPTKLSAGIVDPPVGSPIRG